MVTAAWKRASRNGYAREIDTPTEQKSTLQARDGLKSEIYIPSEKIYVHSMDT